MKIETSGNNFVVSLNEEDMSSQRKMDAMQKLMNLSAKAQNKSIEKVQDEFGVSLRCASNIVYLRTRSWWTQKLEDELIRMDKEEGRP